MSSEYFVEGSETGQRMQLRVVRVTPGLDIVFPVVLMLTNEILDWSSEGKVSTFGLAIIMQMVRRFHGILCAQISAHDCIDHRGELASIFGGVMSRILYGITSFLTNSVVTNGADDL